MYPLKRVQQYINGKAYPVDIMCGNAVPFPFQLSCSLHYFYLCHGVTEEWIVLNECNLRQKFDRHSVDVYDRLIQSFPIWHATTVDEDPNDQTRDKHLFFDRIQKIWFNPFSGLGYNSSNEVAFFRHSHLFRSL
jgi:hypothetical protein